MATTTNFGWVTPDNTDLVKDGASAIRTLGSSIDSSMGDLKGGTTGQVLSKTTGTDMDFTWVTTDDTNAIQNAIVDAKGDLIGATAADTPARLAVGADYGFLQAIAAESTGLKWNAAAWTTYTPTVTAEGGSITSYTVNRAAYIRVGKLCVTNLDIQITNKGTAVGALYVSAPFNSYNNTGSGIGREIAVVGTMVYASMGSNNFQIRKYDATTVLVNSYVLALTMTYEVA